MNLRTFVVRRYYAIAAFAAIGAANALAQTNLPHAQVGLSYSFQVSTTPAAPAGTVYGASGLPTGLSINSSSGLIAGTPTTAGTATGTLSLTSSGVTNNFAYSLVVDPALGTPAITSAATLSATAGTAIGTYTVTASNSPTSFNVGSLPAGLTLGGTTTAPTISGTPTTAGTYSVSLSANNASGTGATTTLTITIAPAGPVPAITSATTASGALNVAFTYAITASNTPVSFSATGLPLGLALNTTSGVISGTPTVAGVYTVALTATNNNGTGASTNLALTIGSVSAITSASTASATVSSAFNFTLAASNSPLSFNVTGLPPGLSAAAATGVISGTPTTVGSYTVTASANNLTGSGPSSTLTITVAAASSGGGGGGGGGIIAVAPIINAQTASFTVVAGNPASFTVVAAGTGTLTYQWRKGGAAIAGATSATYTIANAQLGDAGSYDVVVTNSIGAATSTSITLTVTAILTPPSITTAPASQSAFVGGSVTLTVVASGNPAPTYQWQKNGANLSGAVASTLTLSNLQLTDAGAYTVVLTNSQGTVTSVAVTLAVTLPPAQPVSRLINFSVRANAAGGDQTLIVGFTVGGTGGKQALVRAVGPSLAQFGVANPLADPLLKLFNGSSALVNQNNDWNGDPALTLAYNLVGAFPLPSASKDAALLPMLTTGSYTAQVSGTPAGIALLEVYDADAASSTSRLVNVSARNQVGTGENVLIVGFVITGNAPKNLLIRGIGPSLTQFGVTGALADPQLAVFDAKGATLAQNNDWQGTATLSTAFTNAGAFPLAASSKDAAVIVTVQPGVYTAQVSGVNATTGVGLIELYELP